MSTNPELASEVVLVTGASRGIGRAIAVALARCGATVVGTATTSAGAESVTAYLSEAGLKGSGRVLDVTDAPTVTALVKDIEAALGPVTILVNNAGITRDNLLMRMQSAEWEQIINTNLNAVFRTSKAVLRGMMKKRRGRIVNIGSVVAAMGNAGQSNYAAAKAGLAGFSRSLAREVGSRGITVNVVAPGFIATEMTQKLPQAQQDSLLQNIPLGRMGTPEDVAGVVAFLASPAGGYISGETLHVNGGLHMS